jgi:hypothetical protein
MINTMVGSRRTIHMFGNTVEFEFPNSEILTIEIAWQFEIFSIEFRGVQDVFMFLELETDEMMARISSIFGAIINSIIPTMEFARRRREFDLEQLAQELEDELEMLMEFE